MSYQILNIDQDKKKFKQYWSYFINNYTASTRYTENFISFYLSLANTQNKSFVVIKENKVVGISFLPIEEIEGKNSISINNEFVIAPLSNDIKTEEFIYAQIDKIAKKNKVSKIKLEIDPLISIYEHHYNKLTDYKYLNVNSTSYLIDLRITKNQFLLNLNQSTRHSIKKFIERNEYEVKFIKGKDSSKKIFDAYQNAHFRSAGRKTRSQATFDLQFKMMQNDEAFLTVLNLKGIDMGFLFTSTFQNTACLFSIANLPEYEKEYPIYKIMIYEIFNYLKKHRYQYALFGRPSTKNLVQGFLDYTDEKGLSISKYKRGYGPNILENFRGIKYFDKDCLIEDLDNFKSRTLEVIK